MFSYRHAFHAGNHADVLKHLMLIGTLQHLLQKPAPLTVVDTHAGAGLYRLDGDYANTSGEALDGIHKLWRECAPTPADAKRETVATNVDANLLTCYLQLIAALNPQAAAGGALKVYPGSPVIAHQLLRSEAKDRLRLFELHPTDHRVLQGHVAQLGTAVGVQAVRADGFEALRAQVPPAPSAGGSKRALVLVDPSYELKSDYARVQAAVHDAIHRFATGVYLVWYPIIPRPEAHELPRRLKTLANQAGKAWLHATLNVGAAPTDAAEIDRHGLPHRVRAKGGLNASGVFLVNPPHSLAHRLRQSLPQVLTALGRGPGRAWAIETSS